MSAAMTIIDQARRVAEIAGYEVKDYIRGVSKPWLFRNGQAYIPLDSFIPHRSANQALECLSRVFKDGWESEYCPANEPERKYLVIPTWSELGAESGRFGSTFCNAAVATILAAGGKS